MVPVGVPPPGATTVTIAVITTEPPLATGFGLCVNVTFEAAWLTFTDSGDDALDTYVASAGA